MSRQITILKQTVPVQESPMIFPLACCFGGLNKLWLVRDLEKIHPDHLTSVASHDMLGRDFHPETYAQITSNHFPKKIRSTNGQQQNNKAFVDTTTIAFPSCLCLCFIYFHFVGCQQRSQHVTVATKQFC